MNEFLLEVFVNPVSQEVCFRGGDWVDFTGEGIWRPFLELDCVVVLSLWREASCCFFGEDFGVCFILFRNGGRCHYFLPLVCCFHPLLGQVCFVNNHVYLVVLVV